MTVKEIKKMQVVFSFGSVAYVTIKIFEGLDLAECLKMRSEDICGYIENGKYITI